MNRRAALPLLATFAMLAAVAPAAAEVDSIDADVVYGHKDGLALTYDVLRPDSPNGAAVLFMVSGGWFSSWVDPSQLVSRWSTLGELVDRGFTVFLIRHGSAPRYKVPEAVADVRQALHHVAEHADDYSVDPQRLGVFGMSAGGHLSLMLGIAPESVIADGEPAPTRAAAVVAYFPPVDLQGWTGPNDRFPALDFDAELADDVSPLLYASADDVPTLMIHGDKDTLVPLSHSQRMLAALEEAGVTTELIVLEGAGHGFSGEHETTSSEALISWFETHLVHGHEAMTAPTGSSVQ